MKRVFHHPPRPKRPTIWRSLAELENSPGFETVLRREFPRGADVYEDSGLTKRDFMKLLGASMSLAGIGLAGCRRPDALWSPSTRGSSGPFRESSFLMQRRCRCGRVRCL